MPRSEVSPVGSRETLYTGSLSPSSPCLTAALSSNQASASGSAAETGYAPVVALTHEAKARDLEEALAEIKASGVVAEDPVKLRVL